MTVSFQITKGISHADNPLPETTLSQGLAMLLSPVEYDGYYNREQVTACSPDSLGIEACADADTKVVANVGFNPLIAAAFKCFQDHRPLILSPDMIWLAVLQGTANHINNNAEALRSKFVQHSGQATIVVRRDDFVRGGSNPWPEAFDAFSAAIKEHVGSDTHQKLQAEFSTTGPVETAANDIVLMDSVKSYFKYILVTRCGIPSVELEGTVDDWKQLQSKVQELAGYGLIPDWWNAKLKPITQEFVAAIQGNATPAHWRNIYKWEERSGGDANDGWLIHLLPYVRDHCGDGSASIRNAFKSGGWGGGITTSQIPGGLCSTPFIWDYLGTEFDMNFMAGFAGITQDANTLALRPKIGWVIRDNGELPTPA